jgi:hypothetical protein
MRTLSDPPHAAQQVARQSATLSFLVEHIVDNRMNHATTAAASPSAIDSAAHGGGLSPRTR